MIPVLKSVLLVVVLVFIASSDVDATWPRWTWYNNMWGRPVIRHSVPVEHVNFAQVHHQPMPSLLPISPCQAARANPSVDVQQLLPLLLGGRPQVAIVHVVPQAQPIPICKMQAQNEAAKQPQNEAAKHQQNEAAKQPQKPSAGKKGQNGGADMSNGNVAGARTLPPLRLKLYRG